MPILSITIWPPSETRPPESCHNRILFCISGCWCRTVFVDACLVRFVVILQCGRWSPVFVRLRSTSMMVMPWCKADVMRRRPRRSQWMKRRVGLVRDHVHCRRAVAHLVRITTDAGDGVLDSATEFPNGSTGVCVGGHAASSAAAWRDPWQGSRTDGRRLLTGLDEIASDRDAESLLGKHPSQSFLHSRVLVTFLLLLPAFRVAPIQVRPTTRNALISRLLLTAENLSSHQALTLFWWQMSWIALP